MGWTGDFESKKRCMVHFFNILDSSYTGKIKTKVKVFVFTEQDIVVTEPNGTKTYYCLLYQKTENNKYLYKYMDNSVGPVPHYPIPKEAIHEFLSNPSHLECAGTQNFIKRIKHTNKLTI